MPIDRRTTRETEAAVAANDWLESCSLATYRDVSMLHIRGTVHGYHVDTYIGHQDPTVAASLDDMDLGPVDETTVSARAIDAAVAAVEGFGHVEQVEVVPHQMGEQPQISFTAPGIGDMTLRIANHVDAAREIRLTARDRRLDTQGNTLSALGARTLALAATDEAMLDRIVDTVYRGGTCRYAGVLAQTSSQGVVSTSYMHDGVAMRSDGIEIPDLPETVRLAIVGKQRRRLGQVVEIPGFDDLDIVGIGRNSMEARRKGGTWIRLDVRDRDGARFPQLEIEEGRMVAHEMFRRRKA